MTPQPSSEGFFIGDISWPVPPAIPLQHNKENEMVTK